MLGAPEPTHLDRLAATGVRLERQVVEATRLPAVGLGDPALGPREHLFLEPEFGHRLNGLHELTRSAQVAAEQLHDRVGVAVEDREALSRVPDRERLAVLGLQRLPLGGQAPLAEPGRVTNRVDLEQIVIGEPEADHPRRQLRRVAHPGIARGRVQHEQLADKVSDRPVGVVRVLDHPHDMTDRAPPAARPAQQTASWWRLRSSSTTGRAAYAHPELSR